MRPGEDEDALSEMRNEATLFVVDGPSGAGKSHLLRHVDGAWPGIGSIPKLTTRAAHPWESETGWSDLVHVTPEEFERARPEFRYRFGGNWYGIVERDLRERLARARAGCVVVRDAATIDRLSRGLDEIRVVSVLVRASLETRRKRLLADGFPAGELESRLREDGVAPRRAYLETLDNDAGEDAYHARIDSMIRRYLCE